MFKELAVDSASVKIFDQIASTLNPWSCSLEINHLAVLFVPNTPTPGSVLMVHFCLMNLAVSDHFLNIWTVPVLCFYLALLLGGVGWAGVGSQMMMLFYGDV